MTHSILVRRKMCFQLRILLSVILYFKCSLGRNKGGTILWAPIHYRGAELLLEAPKSPNNVTSTFFNTVNSPSTKELRFDHRGARAPYNLVTPLSSVEKMKTIQ